MYKHRLKVNEMTPGTIQLLCASKMCLSYKNMYDKLLELGNRWLPVISKLCGQKGSNVLT